MSFPYQLIIFYGSSPGAGKSTISAFLVDQLKQHDFSIFWLYEEDILYLDLFQTFVQQIRSGDPNMIDSLLAATERFVERFRATNTISVTDSIFPCFNWLLATNLYATSRIEQFSRQLEAVLRPLRPLLIYLDVDQTIALERAVAQRGEAWLTDTIAALNTYGRNQAQPVQNFADVAAYFKQVGDLSLNLLAQWEGDVWVLDAGRHAGDELKRLVLEKLALPAMRTEQTMPVTNLEHYTGAYQAISETVPPDQVLLITLENSTLRVNAYWPTGSPLMPVEDDQFQLQNTSHRIRFENFEQGIPQGLTYNNQHTIYAYRRLPD